jgi:hypothetical protein
MNPIFIGLFLIAVINFIYLAFWFSSGVIQIRDGVFEADKKKIWNGLRPFLVLVCIILIFIIMSFFN